MDSLGLLFSELMDINGLLLSELFICPLIGCSMFILFILFASG